MAVDCIRNLLETACMVAALLSFTEATCGCASSAGSLQSSAVQHSPNATTAPSTVEQLGAGTVRLIEGDILLSPEQHQELLRSQLTQQQQQQQQDEPLPLAAATQASIYWPNGTVYYSLSSEYTAPEADFIGSSLRELQLSVGSAVTFVRVTPGQVSSYVAVSSGVGCNSYVGRQTGAQALSLQRPDCLRKYIVQHEFIHVLGFWHEQSRSDRGGYIDIWWSFIDSGKCSNFGLFGSPPPIGYPAYDTTSIMHYDSFAFSCDGSAATITSKTTGLIPYPMLLVTSDIQRIQYYYGTGDNTTLSTLGAQSLNGRAQLWTCCLCLLSALLFYNT